ncbi:hypothetical protein BsWGS_26118 [Bradybaena similaris]
MSPFYIVIYIKCHHFILSSVSNATNIYIVICIKCHQHLILSSVSNLTNVLNSHPYHTTPVFLYLHFSPIFSTLHCFLIMSPKIFYYDISSLVSIYISLNPISHQNFYIISSLASISILFSSPHQISFIIITSTSTSSVANI